MNCKQDRERITDWINGQMSAAESEAFELHLAQCEICSAAVAAEKQLWDLMGEIEVPTPSPAMENRFQAMLEDYKKTTAPKNAATFSWVAQFRQLWTMQPKMQMAYSLVLVVMGLGIGYLFSHQEGNKVNQQHMEALSSEVDELKETTMLSLLNDPSASKRIQAVGYTDEIKEVNENVVNALLATLNNDSNVNVRLMTLDALTKLADDPNVREGLVSSIVSQDSPLVQAALADVMLKLQEKRAIGSFKKLLEQKDLNGMVRDKIKQTITNLI